MDVGHVACTSINPVSLSARPPPITTCGKTTNIYQLVTFCTDSWRHPWGRRCTFNTLLVIGWPIFPPPPPWRARAIRFALAHWSFPHSHLLGCGFHPSSSHPRPSSLEAWTSSSTGSAYYTSVRRHSFWHPSEGRPPSAPGRTTTSRTQHLRSIPSKLSAQTPL